MKKAVIAACVLFVLILFQSFNSGTGDQAALLNIGVLPRVAPAPADNPTTEAKVDLGRKLFFDPVLSANNKISCASCHRPSKGFADDSERSQGFSAGTKTKRNTPTVLNAALNGILFTGSISPTDSPQFYDNRARSLEEQCLGPLLSPEEMKGTELSEGAYKDSLEREITGIKEYRTLFYKAFADSVATIDKITKAIASYERTLLTPDSPFDRYLRGEASAMTEEQIRGMETFILVGCSDCHSGPMFSDYKLHVLGVEEHPGLKDFDDGDGNYAFRTTSLRNLAYTAPYMHNGRLSTLEEVMRFYARKNSKHPMVSDKDLAPEFKKLKLNPFNKRQINEILAFLEALNDPGFDQSVPESVPSGLGIRKK